MKRQRRSRVHQESEQLAADAESSATTEKEEKIIQRALKILEARCSPGEPLQSPADVGRYLRLKLGQLRNECFAVLYLNARHEILAFNEHFHGTVDGASVYPRVIVQTSLEVNASAVILAHNHPSGVAEPSESDRQITHRIAKALQLVEVRVLDHLVVSARGVVSFAERGLLR